MARTFDGADDVIRFSIAALSDQTAAGTFAAIVRRTNDVNFHSIVGLHTSANVNELFFQIEPTDTLVLGGDGGTSSSSFTVVTADSWVLVAAAKASGTTTPRFHKYVYSSNTWTHSNGSASMANGTTVGATGYMETSWQGGDLFQGDIAAIGIWDIALSDAQVENLAFSLTGWLVPGGIQALWLFDQSAVSQSVPDLSGNGSDQTALTGTSVSTGSVPVFSYGAPAGLWSTGAAAPSAPPPSPYRRRVPLLVR